jgi:hypothetical protein
MERIMNNKKFRNVFFREKNDTKGKDTIIGIFGSMKNATAYFISYFLITFITSLLFIINTTLLKVIGSFIFLGGSTILLAVFIFKFICYKKRQREYDEFRER